MATIVEQHTEEQSYFARFAELAWLDSVISFVFRLIAKLAEPFLAFGLVASAIDYGSHGRFLESNAHLMTAWITTQALALEGSGGVALAMSFEASAQGDSAKAWTQRSLALMLMLVGGIMFFSEMSAAAPGWQAVQSSPLYVYGMAALRTIVSLWYIAVCRTRSYRYSGEEPAQIAAQTMQAEVAQQVESQLDDVRNDLRENLDELRNVVEGSLAEIPALVQAHVAATTYEVDPAQIRAIAQEVVGQAVMRPSTQRNTDELAQSSAQSKETIKIAAVSDEPARLRIGRYLAEQRAQGREPTLEEIMAACNCAKNTAVKYRREFVGA